MRTNQRAAKVCQSLQPFYFSHRKSALMLAFACTLDEEKAYDASRAAFVQIGKRAGRKKSQTMDFLELASSVPQGLPITQRTENAAQNPFYLLPRDTRCVLVLQQFTKATDTEIQSILKLDTIKMEKALSEANKVDKETIAWLYDKADSMLNKKEIWDSICFQLHKHYAHSRTFRVAALGIVSLLIAAFIFFEGATGLQILSIQTKDPHILADSYLSDNYYLRLKQENLNSGKTISTDLLERLKPLKDDDLIRVAFRFYDQQVMEETRVQDESILDLYTSMYHAGYNRGRLHNLLAKGIEKYYTSYQRPYTPKAREGDFVSPFESLYQSTLSLTKETTFKQVLALYPDIFANKEAFDAYISSPVCLSNFYPIQKLILWNQHILAAEETTAEMIDEYEKVIFAFFNPAGLNGTYTPAPFAYYKQETDLFFPKREKLGQALHTALKDACFNLLPDADLSNDILDGTDCSLFSATLSKARIMELSQHDPRFVFLGVAAPYHTSYPKGMEHALASEASQNLFTTYDVFLVDNQLERYSMNYAAPLDVPQGFIDQLRQTVACEDTLFEQLLGYHYSMRYAHPKKLPGYVILRNMLRNHPDDMGYSLRFFKNFPKMAAN